MGFVNPILGGGGALVRPAIKSPNYVPGSAGWQVSRDGSAEFNDLDLRGVFSGTDYVINADGVFVYSSTPAAGNLTASIAAASGVDSFGNHYVSGVGVYAPGSRYAQLKAGSQQFGPIVGGVPDTVDIAFLQGGLAAFTILSPPDAADGFPTALEADFVSGASGVLVPDGSTEPFLKLSSNGTSVASLRLSGAVVKTGGLGLPVTWQTPSYTANFAAASTGGTYKGLQYRLDAEDNLHLEGAFHSLASTTSATVFTLPTGYRPAVARAFPATSDNSTGVVQTMACLLQVNANGPVQLHTSAATAIGQNYYVNAVIPMGNLS